MTGSPAKLPPTILTFLAPAPACNQRCPACILEQSGEPVTEPVLTPKDYGLFVSEFVAAGIPVRSVTFQGFEVTLPSSWPYLEAAFAVAQVHRIPRDFITNGMLLHKWSDRIDVLDPQRITISLDGSDSATHDRLRGLSGALAATTGSLERFIARAPRFLNRLAVYSTLYPGKNLESLERMPGLLSSFGVMRWAVGPELELRDDRAAPTAAKMHLVKSFARLKKAAENARLHFHVSDDFGFFEGEERALIEARTPDDLERCLRLDPMGYVRRGLQIAERWEAGTAHRWRPGSRSAATLLAATPGNSNGPR